MTRQNTQPIPIPFPVRGLDKNFAYWGQPKDTTADAKNVRAYDAIDRRLRGGSRPGLSKWNSNLVNGAGDDIRNMNRLITTPVEAEGVMTDLPIAQTGGTQIVTHNLSDGTQTDSFSSPGSSKVGGMVRDYNGNIFAAGSNQTTTNYNAWKLNPDLTISWEVYVDNDSSDLEAIAYDPRTHRLAVAGSNGSDGNQLWILDPDTGTVLAQFDPDSNGSVHNVKFDSIGNLYVAITSDVSHHDHKPLIKYDINYNEVWSWTAQRVADNGHILYSIFIDSDDNVYVGGKEADEWDDTEGGTDTSTKNIWAFDSDGNLLWSYLTDDGGGGHTVNTVWKVFLPPNESNKVYIGKDGGDDHENVVKLDISDVTAITEDWTYQTSTTAGDQITAIDVDEYDNLFVGGHDSNTWAGAGAEMNIWRLNKDDGSLHSNDDWPINTGSSIINDFAFTTTGATGINSTFRASILTVVSNTDIFSIRDGSVITPANGTDALTETATNLPFSQPAFGRMFFIDGKNEVYYTPYEDTADDTVSIWIPTAGILPINPKLMTLYRGRIVLSGVTSDPHNWFMSKVGDPFNWDYAPSTATVVQAIAGNNSEAGLVGDLITALIPYSDDLLVFGGDHTIWIMSGDPAAGGSLDEVSDRTGILWGKAWTTGPKGEIYFAGTDGVYRLVPGQSLENITDKRIKKIYDAIDRDADRVLLEWDYLQQGLMMLIVDDGWDITNAQTTYFWEERTGAWWEDTYPKVIGPLSMFAYDADLPADKALLLGGADGYIRQVDFSVGYDIAADDTQIAIDSYIEYPPLFMNHNRANTKLTELSAIIGENSGDVDLLLKVAQSAERLSVNASTKFKRTLSTGRNKMKPRLAANTIGLELNKSSVNRWAIDSMDAVVSSQGQVRRVRSS